MAVMCPVCGEGVLKAGEKMIYCDNRKSHAAGTEWSEGAPCDFHIVYAQRVFGRFLSLEEIRWVLNGETLLDGEGNSLTLDLGNDSYIRTERKTIW